MICLDRTKRTVQEWIELDKKHFIHPNSSLQEQHAVGPAAIMKEGNGIYVTDVNGKRYIEAMSSLLNVNIGYGRKELGAIAYKQMVKLPLTSSFATFSNKPAIELAAAIARLSPGDLNAVLFTSSGSEANDVACKLARYYWRIKGYKEKVKILVRKKAYHELSEEITPGFLYVEPFCLESLRKTIQENEADTIAAFVSEPVLGSKGVQIPPDDYFHEARKLCDEANILFIGDEMISGLGRTGKLFGCEHWNVVPDILLLSNGLTSGYFPLGAVVLKEGIQSDLTRLSKGKFLQSFTDSGHPSACAVALGNIDILLNEKLTENAASMGNIMKAHLKKMQSKYEIIRSTRSLGLLGALDFHTTELYSPLAPAVAKHALRLGLIVKAVALGGSDTIVMAPPLVINEKEVSLMFRILEHALVAVSP